MSSPKEIVAAKANVGSLACAATVSDLRTHCCPQTGFDQLTPGLDSHAFLDATQGSTHCHTYMAHIVTLMKFIVTYIGVIVTYKRVIVTVVKSIQQDLSLQ